MMRMTTTSITYFLLLASSHCAKAFLSGLLQPKQAENRIVGGDIAGSYPAYAKLSSDTDSFCGSTLVHSDILISAAHCDGFVGDNAYLGSNRIDGSDADEVISITAERLHPRYSQADSPDIMLYKLSRPSAATPVSLNTNQGIPRDNDLVRTIGFGLTTDGGDPSNRLLEVDVNVVAFGTCSESYDGLVENDMLCAAAPGKDSCQNDSGGPLLRQDGTLVGIVSFGDGCAVPGSPGVYARVSGSMDFIRRGICEMSADPPSDCGDLADVGDDTLDDGGNDADTGDDDGGNGDADTGDDGGAFDDDDNNGAFDDDDNNGAFDDDDNNSTFDDDDNNFDDDSFDDDNFDDDDLNFDDDNFDDDFNFDDDEFRTAKKLRNGSGNTATCFSGVTNVVVKGRGRVLMKDLKIGDKVQTSQGFSPVYSFLHIDHDTETMFLKMSFTNQEESLEISPLHLVSSHGALIAAKDIQPGDMLDGVVAHSKIVASIEVVMRRGFYAPATFSGDLVVSGVLASNYVTILDKTALDEHHIAHAYMAPFRWYCTLISCEGEPTTGSNEYPMFVFPGVVAAKILSLCSPSTQYIVTALIAPIVFLVRLADFLLLHAAFLLVIMMAVGGMVLRGHQIKSKNHKIA